MKIDRKEIMKTAASQLRSLSSEVQEYRDLEVKRDLAEEIVKKTSDDLTSSEVFEKISELMDKDLEELKIIDKAVELHNTGELNLGSLSPHLGDGEDMDPLTAMLVEDM